MQLQDKELLYAPKPVEAPQTMTGIFPPKPFKL